MKCSIDYFRRHRRFQKFSSGNLVAKWNRPILIYQGGKNYRVPPEQGMQAFQAAQLPGLKAAQLLNRQLEEMPRTHEGSIWHKAIYPWQVWLDGLYMGQPFNAEYAKLFVKDAAIYDDIVTSLYGLKTIHGIAKLACCITAGTKRKA